jgi:hypothetical protein
MAIEFAPTFTELLRRVLSRCLAQLAMPRTFRRDQVALWIQRRLEAKP